MGFNIWSLLIILLIVALLFGTRKLRNIGGDLGGAIRGFKDSMREAEEEEQEEPRRADDERSREEPEPLEHQEEPGQQQAAASSVTRERAGSSDRDTS